MTHYNSSIKSFIPYQPGVSFSHCSNGAVFWAEFGNLLWESPLNAIPDKEVLGCPRQLAKGWDQWVNISHLLRLQSIY